MIKRIFKLSFLGVFMALVLGACNKDYVEMQDMQNRKVKVPKKIDRVVCLSAGMSELFYELGIEDKLVGRSSFAHLPKEIETKPICGGLTKLDTVAILQVQPDIVFSDESIPWNERRFLARNNIPLFIFKRNRVVQDMFPAINLFAKIFNKNNEAQQLTNKLQEQLKNLDKSQSNNKKTAYYVVGFAHNINLTVNGSQLIGDIMRKAGLTNIAEDDLDMKYDLKDLQSKSPYYIIVPQRLYENFINKAPFMFLQAVRENRVIAIDDNMLNALSISNIKAIEHIEKSIL